MGKIPRYLEQQLVDRVKVICRQASSEGVTPTHAGVHPDDFEAVKEFCYHGGKIVYRWKPGGRCEVELVADPRVPRGHANVVNAEAAFVAGYAQDLPE